jgi:hypothetical protein
MANTSIDLVGLDFSSLKSNLKTFLKNNTQFKDIDYEGSNINVLLDVLAYNTYLNAFYTNMVASEMFLDTAQLRDSVVSHAKELNYTPRSFVSSKATITVDITPSTAVSSIVVPKYTSFTARVGSNTFTFSTNEATVITTSNNGVYSLTTDVYEGNVLTETFVVDASNTSQRYVVSNPTVDVMSLDVTVYEDGGTTALTYTQSESIVGVKSSSTVFFVQAAENQQYELVFGDGVYGRTPKSGSYVVVKYRAGSGQLPNGALKFSPDSTIDGHSNITVKTVSGATGGDVAESITSIKFNAPRSFKAQDRAVTVSDYETLLKSRFSDIKAISVYGGEEANPPRFGRVIVSVDVADADGVSEVRQKAFLDYIRDKTPVSINVDFIKPDFMYLEVTSNVFYNVNKTTKTTADIKSLVQSAVTNYSFNSLEDFKTTMHHSELLATITNADTSIISNDTSVRAIRRVIPTLNTDLIFTVDFENALQTETGLKTSFNETHYGHTITTSSFTYNNTSCLIVDDSLGNLYVAAQEAGGITILKKVGTVNYTTGFLTFAGLSMTSYEGNYLKIKAKTLSQNIGVYRNTILQIDVAKDVTVNVTGVKQ